jgi:uncharacterized membrane protein YraQ (UPF0718 family)
VIAVVVAATWFGPFVIPNEGFYSGACSALLAGGLVHLVIQHSTPLHVGLSERRRNFWSGVGAIGAAAAIVFHLGLAPDAGAHQHGNAALPGRFFDLFLETAPPLLVGVLGAGLIDAFLPQGAVRYLARGSRLRQALSGVLVGAPMPDVLVRGAPDLPLADQEGRFRRRRRWRLLVAAPEIGVDSVLLSWNQLGGTATIARVVCALLVALAVGWIVGRVAEREPATSPATPTTRRRTVRRRSARRSPPCAAACSRRGATSRPGSWSACTRRSCSSLDLGGLGAPPARLGADPGARPAGHAHLHLRGGGDALRRDALIKGFTPGAVIAFLLLGPATNLTTFGALRRLHSRSVAYAFLAVALGATFVLGLGVDLVLTRIDFTTEIAEHASEHGLVHQVCAAILLGLTAWVILRSGPRSFVEQLKPEPDETAHTPPAHPRRRLPRGRPPGFGVSLQPRT